MTDIELETHEVTDFESLIRTIDVIENRTPGMLWWRGQGEDWPLIPTVFRGGPHPVQRETSLLNHFRRMAPARYDRCPDWKNLPRWLFLMQHFRGPTRLLDWSESPLVGLFFAVEEQAYARETGVLWALDAFEFNGELHGTPALFLAEHEAASELLRDAFRWGAADKETAAALAPVELDARMMLQLGGFTVHGSPTPLDMLDSAAGHLKKIIIRDEAKPEMKRWLRRLGIRRRNLFPDLGSLAQEVGDLRFSEIEANDTEPSK